MKPRDPLSLATEVIESQRRITWLAGLLDDPDDEVKIAAIEGLRKVSDPGEDNIVILAKQLLSNPRATVAKAVVAALVALGSRSLPAKPILDSVIADDTIPKEIRIGATSVLGCLGLAAVDSLCRAFTRDSCIEVRHIAGQALLNISTEVENPSDAAVEIKAALGIAMRREANSWMRDLIAKASSHLKTVRKGTSGDNKIAVAPPDIACYPATPAQAEDWGGGVVELGTERALRAAELIALISAESSPHFAAAYSNAKELFILTKQEIASRLTRPLNTKLRRMPQETYEEKKTVASWVNTELRELGLAIRCPKTGRPAILIADIRGGGDDSSRFRLEVTEDDGRKVRSWTGSDLSGLNLELRDDDPRKEGPTIRRARG